DVNEEWLADKGRFCYDGLSRQRLVVPMIRQTHGKLEDCTWEDALIVVGEKLLSLTDPTRPSIPANQVAGVVGPFADAEAMVALKDLINRFNSELCCTEEAFPPN
ncbi:uncharacterized protein DEA37_0010315, partial [Paragonimus westermani]